MLIRVVSGLCVYDFLEIVKPICSFSLLTSLGRLKYLPKSQDFYKNRLKNSRMFFKIPFLLSCRKGNPGWKNSNVSYIFRSHPPDIRNYNFSCCWNSNVGHTLSQEFFYWGEMIKIKHCTMLKRYYLDTILQKSIQLMKRTTIHHYIGQ